MSTILKYHLTWTFFFQIIPLQHYFPKLVIQIQQNIGKRIRLKQQLRSWIHIRCGRQWAGTVRLNPKLRYKYTNFDPTKTSGLELNATATIITLIIIFLISISFIFSPVPVIPPANRVFWPQRDGPSKKPHSRGRTASNAALPLGIRLMSNFHICFAYNSG